MQTNLRGRLRLWRKGGAGDRDYKGTQTFEGDEYIHYHDCGDGFMGVHICQNLPNWAL